jgi:hypothetical protein
MKRITLTLLTIFFCQAAFCQNNSEEIAIKQLLEKESYTWRQSDLAAHASCWAIRPYIKIVISTTEGKSFEVPIEYIVNPPVDKMGDGGTSSNSNYVFSIHGDQAWVYHDEVSISKDGKKAYSHEIRFLEKEKGDWKLVGQTIHSYIPSK